MLFTLDVCHCNSERDTLIFLLQLVPNSIIEHLSLFHIARETFNVNNPQEGRKLSISPPFALVLCEQPLTLSASLPHTDSKWCWLHDELVLQPKRSIRRGENDVTQKDPEDENESDEDLHKCCSIWPQVSTSTSHQSELSALHAGCLNRTFIQRNI